MYLSLQACLAALIILRREDICIYRERLWTRGAALVTIDQEVNNRSGTGQHARLSCSFKWRIEEERRKAGRDMIWYDMIGGSQPLLTTCETVCGMRRFNLGAWSFDWRLDSVTRVRHGSHCRFLAFYQLGQLGDLFLGPLAVSLPGLPGTTMSAYN